ncbi:MAG TPA: peptide MFS transporter [Sphingomicrobium sp.]|jgi:POT family proton-dependent oligopeptide transporter|nr:peptide MFS transporter [Sphingomicrobium sp.]
MTVAEATPDYEIGTLEDRAFLGHPKGLGYLGFTEACERFSYYSMQTLLVLYMVNYLLVPGRMEHVIGLRWLQTHVYHGLSGQPLASAIFGTYAALVYGTPILGGIIADKWLGRDRTLILGGVLMAIGHFLMAIQSAFVFALTALVLGVGAFKGNIATQVGALYGPNDLRRAMAFQIFYIFINVSVIVAPLISGTLGQKVGWHYGFGCAGVVMVLGLFIYLSGRRYLAPEELKSPSEEPALREPLTREDWICVLYLLILIPVLAVSLLTNQEIFNGYLVWGDQQFDLRLLNNTSSWLITVDAAVSFAMLVAVAAFWKWWGTHHREPDEISKMIIGSVFSVAGGLCLFMAALTQPAGGKISLFWPMLFELMNSIGFAHVLPISLALFSKISPKQITSTVIGLYYFSFFIANALVGYVGGLYSSLPTTTFWLIHVASAAFGLVAFVVFKMVIGHRMQSSPKDQARALS